MTRQPTQLKLLEDGRLQIEWNDGETRQYRVAELRNECPCANCSEKRKSPPPSPTSLPVISMAETEPLRIAHMEPMGRYAYAIHFSDGHNSGLFTLESLSEMGSVVQQ
ncbi:MAG: DUF971 domain-containing protein [Planctomycetes bacterium]|nr:DUF971 domain-containing protein [Planctomycetota bacterium]